MPKKKYLYLIAVVITSCIFALALIIFDDSNFSLFNQISTPIAQESPTSETKPSPSIKNHENSDGPFRVIKVRDGDTIELENGMVIRYLYVDTPETVKPNTPVQCFGSESSTFNKEYVLDKVVYLVKDKDEKDQYDRDLRLVFIEGKDTRKPEQSVNAELVKLGFAKAKFYSPNTTYKKQFQELEQIAKDKKLGLWGTCETKTNATN
jgi:micrococcal nuclease